MPNFILRVIRPVERTAEYEYMKEFFRFIGYLVTDYAVDDTKPANWRNALIPEEQSSSIDIVMNCPDDPYFDKCRQLKVRRIYCRFDFNMMCGEVTEKPLLPCRRSENDKRHLRQEFLRALIKRIWADDEPMQKEITEIVNIYLAPTDNIGEMFYFLQAKRNLFVLNMGEVLQEPTAQVTKIALSSYIKVALQAMWAAYCRLEKVEGLHSTYAQVNVAKKIYEIAAKLYDTELPQIKDIQYEGRTCVPPELQVLIQKLEELVERNPEFVSAHLLLANIYRESPWTVDAEERCYIRLWQSISKNTRDYAFVWYRNAYFYEKRKRNALDIALEYYRRAVEQNPDCYQAWFKLGYYAAADNRFELAERMLRQMILAVFHGRSTNPDADGMYTTWLALSPKESQYLYKAYILLARIALKQNQENALKEYVGRACMAATIFEDATTARQISNWDGTEYEESFQAFHSYHLYSAPVWAMWQVLSRWTENIIQDYFVRDIVRQRQARWLTE